MSDQAQRIPRRRWGIGVLVGAGVLVNYFDRINLSVSGPQLQHEFGLTTADMGLLFSAFFWSYALLQVPTGLVLDRFGVTLVGRIGSFLWAGATLLITVASGFGGVFAARVVLGVAEAPAFPANSKATGYWFPRQERALSTAIFDAAAKFSNVIGVPVVALVSVTFGWRWGFGFTAALSFLYFLAFLTFYRDPNEDSKLSQAERDYIHAGGATPEGQSDSGAGRMLGYLLANRKVWGLTIGFAAYGYTFYLFLTWLPGYLVQTMHMSILTSAGFSTIPWMCATIADLVVGGWLIDHLVARGLNESRVRKTVLICGMLVGLSAAAPVGWSIPSLIAPQGGTGTIGGIMNFANNMMGVVAPAVTGFVVGETQSFGNAFLIAGVVLAIGILSYVFILGKIEPIADPSQS